MASSSFTRPRPARNARAAAPAPLIIGNPQDMFMSTSVVGDLGCNIPSSSHGRTQSFVEKTGRKTWKTQKDRKEAVWPPHIESVLFDGKKLLH